MTRDLRGMTEMVDATLTEKPPEEGVAGNVPFFHASTLKAIVPDSRASAGPLLAAGSTQTEVTL